MSPPKKTQRRWTYIIGIEMSPIYMNIVSKIIRYMRIFAGGTLNTIHVAVYLRIHYANAYQGQ